jgi:hypothetical protein
MNMQGRDGANLLLTRGRRVTKYSPSLTARVRSFSLHESLPVSSYGRLFIPSKHNLRTLQIVLVTSSFAVSDSSIGRVSLTHLVL